MLITSEAVAPGHPDKTCDIIADALVDATLEKNPNAHCAYEILGMASGIIIAGETTQPLDDAERIAREALRRTGWNRLLGIDPESFPIAIRIRPQSEEIKNAVDHEDGQTGAGDQGILWGYADNSNPEALPLPWLLARSIARSLWLTAKETGFTELGCDAKTQATLSLKPDGTIESCRHILVSASHTDRLSLPALRSLIWKKAIIPACEKHRIPLPHPSAVSINPAGEWHVSGFNADTGLTGRKTAVDSYGGCARTGGGALSGKDMTKTDRSGAYMARLAARSIVRSRLADRAEVQLAYAIGQPKPLAVTVDTHGTGSIGDEAIAGLLSERMDFTPDGMSRSLPAPQQGYAALAAFGHYGHCMDWDGDPFLPAWEMPMKDIRLSGGDAS